MTPPFPIVYFGNDWTAENRTSSHHIAERLARRHPLLYVDCPGMRAPRASGRDVRKIFNKLSRAAEKPRQVGDQMWQMVLPQLPFAKLPFGDEINREAGGLLVKRATRLLGMRRPVSWFHVPHAAVMLGQLDERLSIYYCTDNHIASPGVDKTRIGRLDEKLTREADQVFVTAQTLLDAKQPLNPHVLYSPHGVDADHFGRAEDPSLELAAPIRNIRSPVIGYFGLFEGWTDVPLLEMLGKKHPEWTFLIVGRVAADVSRLEALGNFIFPGPQPYAELPQWAKAFDVCIYPGGDNDFVKNANPLKIREYLATGRPVVSVRSREVERFEGIVRIADSHEEFLHHLEDALANDSDDDRAARKATVAQLTWDARVASVLEVVERRLAERESSASASSPGARAVVDTVRATAAKVARRSWMTYVLRTNSGTDNGERLERAYRVVDPWVMDSPTERHRFEQTNQLIATHFGRPKRVLEIGCGEGHQSAYLTNLCEELRGIDVSETAVERAKARVPNASFDSVGLWDYAEGELADLVTACEVLYYLDDVPAAVKRMSELGAACLVTYYDGAAKRVEPALADVVDLQRETMTYGSVTWHVAWWRNPTA